MYLERALFMLGEKNSGKSTQLRSMFLDRRLGSSGRIPNARNLANSYSLSNERFLYLRLTSPHETNETMNKFLKKCEREMQPGNGVMLRWNFAGAVQVSPSNILPKGEQVIEAFKKHFLPERIRVVILYPSMKGTDLLRTMDFLLSIGCEVVNVNDRSRKGNGLIYADFFDFT